MSHWKIIFVAELPEWRTLAEVAPRLELAGVRDISESPPSVIRATVMLGVCDEDPARARRDLALGRLDGLCDVRSYRMFRKPSATGDWEVYGGGSFIELPGEEPRPLFALELCDD